MTGATHLASGVLLAAALPWADPAAAIGIAVGVLLPDIDSPTSTIGRLIPILPRLIKHRTWTHTLWLAALLGALWWPLGLGVLVHLALDMLTKDGLSPLWPCKWKLRLPLSIKTGGTVDRLLGCICWLGAAVLCWGWVGEIPGVVL